MHKIVNGKRVELTEAEIAEVNERERLHAEEVKSVEYKNKRAAIRRSIHYPDIGDQLDAILKQLNYMQMSGQTNLVSELDVIVGKWLKVKRDFPIDNNEEV